MLLKLDRWVMSALRPMMLPMVDGMPTWATILLVGVHCQWKGSKILDLACGTGPVSYPAAMVDGLDGLVIDI